MSSGCRLKLQLLRLQQPPLVRKRQQTVPLPAYNKQPPQPRNLSGLRSQTAHLTARQWRHLAALPLRPMRLQLLILWAGPLLSGLPRLPQRPQHMPHQERYQQTATLESAAKCLRLGLCYLTSPRRQLLWQQLLSLTAVLVGNDSALHTMPNIIPSGARNR